MDKNLKILEVNPATLNQSGYSAKEMLGKKIISFFSEDCRSNFGGFVKNKTQKNPNREIKFIKKNKSQIIMDCSVSTILDKQGNLQFYYAFLRDITKKKEIEKE
jgi:PAS domain S-box-containing protein